MAKTKAKTEKTNSTDVVTVFLTINGTDYSSTGDSFSEALAGLPVVTPRTQAKLSIQKDGKTSKVVLFPIPLFKRLFYPGLSGDVARSRLLTVHKYS